MLVKRGFSVCDYRGIFSTRVPIKGLIPNKSSWDSQQVGVHIFPNIKAWHMIHVIIQRHFFIGGLPGISAIGKFHVHSPKPQKGWTIALP